MGTVSSLLHFGVPATATAVSFWVLRPALEGALGPLPAYLVAMAAPLAAMAVAAVLGCVHVEHTARDARALAVRLRFESSATEHRTATIAVLLAAAVGSGLLSIVSRAAARHGLLAVPSALPDFLDPSMGMSPQTLDSAVNGSIAGRWELLVLFLVVFALNIVGEEVWWRGYVLPRQEAAYGDRAWLVHGTLWTAFHAFKWWDILTLLPMCLLIARTAQRTRSTWPGLIAHGALNAVAPLTLALAIAS